MIDDAVAGLERRLAKPVVTPPVSGNFLEAAVAYFEATGKRKMLDAAIKAADAMDATFGPGKKTYISGHEGLKIGLIRLYRQTGDARYARLAQFFMDERGKDDYPRTGEYAIDRTYAQDHAPVTAQREAVGHAVRATYLYVPLADVAALTAKREYDEALDAIWQDASSHKTYVTGAIGSIRFHEQFGGAYELPNLSAWNETCASYGYILWNHRMFLRHREGRYLDLMERTLYNGFLAGVSIAGDRFFYQNPLTSYGNYERFDWINVPCCPPNVVRLLASLGSYVYARETDNSAIYVNLFVGSSATVRLADNPVKIRQETRYPWEGRVKIAVDPAQPATFDVAVRIPGWIDTEVMPGGLYQFMNASGSKESGIYPRERPGCGVAGRQRLRTDSTPLAARRCRRADPPDAGAPRRCRRARERRRGPRGAGARSTRVRGGVARQRRTGVERRRSGRRSADKRVSVRPSEWR